MNNVHLNIHIRSGLYAALCRNEFFHAATDSSPISTIFFALEGRRFSAKCRMWAVVIANLLLPRWHVIDVGFGPTNTPQWRPSTRILQTVQRVLRETVFRLQTHTWYALRRTAKGVRLRRKEESSIALIWLIELFDVTGWSSLWRSHVKNFFFQIPRGTHMYDRSNFSNSLFNLTPSTTTAICV